MNKLSNDIIIGAAHSDTPKRIFDGGGLYIEINPNSSRYWRLKYRFDGKEKRLSIGVYPEVGLRQAREARRRAKELLAEGKDPSSIKKLHSGFFTNAPEALFGSVQENWVVSEYEDLESRVVSKYRQVFKKHLSVLNDIPVKTLTARHINDIVLALQADCLNDTAHLVRRLFNRVMQYAIESNVISTFQFSATDVLDPLIRNSNIICYKSAPQIKDLGAKIATMTNLNDRAAMSLLALTLVSLDQICSAQWVDFDLEDNVWYPGGVEQDDILVPLSDQAVRVLESLFASTGHKRYLFVKGKKGVPKYSSSMFAYHLKALGVSMEEHKPSSFGDSARHILPVTHNTQINIIDQQLRLKSSKQYRVELEPTDLLAERMRMMQDWADVVFMN